MSASFFWMKIYARGGSGKEDPDQFLLFVCLSDEWECLWKRTWVGSSPLWCRKHRAGWQVLLHLLPATPVRACECSWWVRSWEIAYMTVMPASAQVYSCVSGSVLFQTGQSLLRADHLKPWVSLVALGEELPPNCWSHKQASKRILLAPCGEDAPSSSSAGNCVLVREVCNS